MITSPANPLLAKIKVWPASDFILLVSATNRRWLTNFASSDGLILIEKKTATVQFFLDPRYYSEAKKKVVGCQILALQTFSHYWKKLQGKVSFEKDLPYNFFSWFQKLNPALTFLPYSFEKWRMIKTPQEIAKLRKVCQLTVQIWEKIVLFCQTKKTVSEKEVEKFLLTQLLQHGLHESAFFPIVASDTNAAHIHTRATNQIVRDHLLCDFGGKWEGYCSDFTRTLLLNPTSKIKPYYHLLDEIHQKILAFLKPGITIQSLVNYCQILYKSKGLTLPHALGHGIGLKVHELPTFSPDNDLVLEPGMVFTIEPGIYLSKIGGVRKEDVILITATGYEVLTS